MRGRRYVLVGDLADAGDRADDVVELAGEVVELFGLQLQTRQPCEVGDLLARDARHAAILWVRVCGLAQSYGSGADACAQVCLSPRRTGPRRPVRGAGNRATSHNGRTDADGDEAPRTART